MSKRPGDSKNSKGKGDSLKGGIGGGMSTQDKIDEMFLKSLREEEKRDYGGVDLSKKLVDQIPTIKQNLKYYDLARVKQEIALEIAMSKRKEMNMNVAHWKKWFLFPYANISPMPDIETAENIDEIANDNDKSFNRLVSKKYLFPLEVIMSKSEWYKELQTPLSVTSEDIQRDLTAVQQILDFLNKNRGDRTDNNKLKGRAEDLVNIELTARLIGLLSHFIYWVVFGHTNPNPLSVFHMKQLFISIM